MTMGEQYAPIHFITAIEEVSINPLAEKLTPRKLQVLKWLIEDKSNKKMFSISRIPRSNNTSKRFTVKWGQPTWPKRPLSRVKQACSDLGLFVFDLHRKALSLPFVKRAFRCLCLV